MKRHQQIKIYLEAQKYIHTLGVLKFMSDNHKLIQYLFTDFHPEIYH